MNAFRLNALGPGKTLVSPTSALKAEYGIGRLTAPPLGTLGLFAWPSAFRACQSAVIGGRGTAITEVQLGSDAVSVAVNKLPTDVTDRDDVLRFWKTVRSLHVLSSYDDGGVGPLAFVTGAIVTLRVVAHYEKELRVLNVLSEFYGEVNRRAMSTALNCTVNEVGSFHAA